MRRRDFQEKTKKKEGFFSQMLVEERERGKCRERVILQGRGWEREEDEEVEVRGRIR